MARIPDDVIERLKSQVDLAGLVRAKGVELGPHGKDLIGLCPFHDDKEPSLVVTPAKNLWHCLGACQQGGSAIDWVMKAEGLSFRHAVELLQKAPEAAVTSPRVVKAGSVRRLDLPFERDAGDDQVFWQVVDFYHATLKESPEALAYLEKRGLSSSEMVDKFKLGYANRTLGYRLPIKACKTGGELRGRLQSLGILRESGHEHFAGSLVIPVLDETGRVVEMYGRKLNDNLRKGTPLHLYLPGPHRGVFNVDVFGSCPEIILCESLIDALTFWCAGFRNVTASYGVEGFGQQHREAFKRHGIKRVLIAYDRDEAGDRAAEKLSSTLLASGMDCFRIKFPHGMDANEYACKVQPAARSLELLIRNAEWIGKGDRPAQASDDQPEAELLTRDDEKEASPSPLASPLPPAPAADLEVTHKDDELQCQLGDRRWRVRGFSKNSSFEQLKVNVLVSTGDKFHVDTLDLYAAKQRGAYIRQAAAELGLEEAVIKHDLGRLLLKLEAMQEQLLAKTLEPKRQEVTLSDDDRAQALELLKDPRLLERILEDFERCGVVGEQVNKLVGYLAAVSRKLDEPLAIIVQSSSAAGKSSLMEAILAFVPEEDRTKYSAMTGQSLFYMGESNLKHKVLAIVEEEGAERASYALKLLQSEGELTIASTGKDPETGRLITHEYHVEGPVMIFLTTTAIEVDEELLNRCMVLTVDEDREQTRAIHKLQRQRKTLEGLLANQDRDIVRNVHQNAQRLLRPLVVANPFAEKLTFLDDRTRTRRDHMKYLTLIQSIALLHQYQRPIKTVDHHGRVVQYIEVTLGDIEVANQLAHQVLGRSLDELPPQTRRLLNLIHETVSAECKRLKVAREDFRFTRREVREHSGWTYAQVRVHIDRLVELEYLVPHHGRRGQTFCYELLYSGEGQAGAPFMMGLVATSALGDAGTTQSLRGQNPEFEVPLTPHCAPIEGLENSEIRNGDDEIEQSLRFLPESTSRGKKNGKSYVLVRHSDSSSSIAALAAAKSC